jgi:hypothetical protein
VAVNGLTATTTTSATTWAPPALTVVEEIKYKSPESLCQATALLTSSIVDILPCVVADDEDCPICFEALHKEPAIRIKQCQHSFHERYVHLHLAWLTLRFTMTNIIPRTVTPAPWVCFIPYVTVLHSNPSCLKRCFSVASNCKWLIIQSDVALSYGPSFLLTSSKKILLCF